MSKDDEYTPHPAEQFYREMLRGKTKELRAKMPKMLSVETPSVPAIPDRGGEEKV